MTTTKQRRRLGWHWNGTEWKYCWAQSATACPYGDSGHTDTHGLVKHAVQQGGGTLPDGRMVIPVADHLYKTGSGKRSQYFRDDGTQMTGDELRTYRRTRAREDRALRARFGALTVEEKLEQLHADLFRYEVEQGALAETHAEHPVTWQHWKAYTRTTWRGLFTAFFKSEWDKHADAPSLRKRYRWTLRGMFAQVHFWATSR